MRGPKIGSLFDNLFQQSCGRLNLSFRLLKLRHLVEHITVVRPKLQRLCQINKGLVKASIVPIHPTEASDSSIVSRIDPNFDEVLFYCPLAVAREEVSVPQWRMQRRQSRIQLFRRGK